MVKLVLFRSDTVISFHTNGTVARGTLAEDYELVIKNSIYFMEEDSPVLFYENGKICRLVLIDPNKVSCLNQKVKIIKDVHFYKNGSIKIYKTYNVIEYAKKNGKTVVINSDDWVLLDEKGELVGSSETYYTLRKKYIDPDANDLIEL